MLENLESKLGKYLEVKSNLVFKALFGREESKGLLLSFLNSILNLKIEKEEDIRYLMTERVKPFSGLKVTYLDLLVEVINNGIKENINIEIQLSNHDCLKERLIYYMSEIHTSRLNKGEHYTCITKTVCLSILDFVLLKETKKYFNVFTLKDSNAVELSNSLTFCTLELPKFNKSIEESSCLNELWILLLKSNKDEEFIMLSERDENIKQAIEALERLSCDENTRYQYLAERHALRSYITDMTVNREKALEEGKAKGFAEGHAEGHTEGHAQAILETASKMKKLGYSPKEIKDLTGLREDALVDN